MSATVADPLATRSSLLRRVKDWNDQSAWQQFCELYRPLIVHFALKQGFSEAEAEDLAQETLVAVAKAIRTFEYDRTRSSFKHWLLTVTRHRIADYWRQRPQSVGAGTGQLQTDASRAGAGVEALWEAEWAQCVQRLALERLKGQVKPRHFQIFYLVGIKGQPPAQVARAFGVSRATVYVVKHRLRARFKKALAWAAQELG